MTSPLPSTKLRVLCLHGFRTNRQVMESQTRGLRDALGPNTEYVFLNGPFEARGPTDEIIDRKFGHTAPFYEWWANRYLEKEEREDIEAEDGVLRGTTRHWCLQFEDIDQAIEAMDEKLNKLGEFDLAVGFSQGAIMLTILSMWYLQKSTKRWWKLVVCVCGVRPRGINVRELFETHEGEKIMPYVHCCSQRSTIERPEDVTLFNSDQTPCITRSAHAWSLYALHYASKKLQIIFQETQYKGDFVFLALSCFERGVSADKLQPLAVNFMVINDSSRLWLEISEKYLFVLIRLLMMPKQVIKLYRLID
ncbi:hypothetical protein PsorP6_009158 [Peronosclerospora sorghi]|uniref:Uncharacterized protein n=1 Tax=Peronosclerospora sorghi TaxID=230839 RepID=A0ACC0VYT9_9STRA|nr:hypothetical protein PsorP6_009158 [Peronosclerospora sorghi]